MANETNSINFSRSFSTIFVLSALFLAGCTPHTDAMAGWKELGLFSHIPVPETIQRDARAYFLTLPEVERNFAEDDSHLTYLEDGTGQHAVVLDAYHDNEFWNIALIYDRGNRRIKVLKYSTGSYME